MFLSLLMILLTFYCLRLQDIEKGSTYSADSGAVLEMGDGRDSRTHFSKSQSIPDTRRVGLVSQGGPASAVGSKKSDYDRVHDSGLCLHADSSVSSVAQSGLMAPPPVPPKEKVLHWITNNDKWQDGSSDVRGSDPSSSKHRSRPPSSTSPISSRRSRKPAAAYGTSRSESLERASAAEDEAARNRPATKPKYGYQKFPL